MQSEIKNIKIVYKSGAFGDTNSIGCWIYGKRPDGKTVACKNVKTDEGGIRIWSFWKSPECKKDEIEVCSTEFSKFEWEKIRFAKESEQQALCNLILKERISM